MKLLFQTAWVYYKDELASLILFFYIGFFLCITIILIPNVLNAWTSETIRYIKTSNKPRIAAYFYFHNYLKCTLLVSILTLLIFLGLIVGFIPGLFLSILFMYSFFVLSCGDQNAFDSLILSEKLTTKKGKLLKHFLLWFVSQMIFFCGILYFKPLCLLGFPYCFLLIALSYLELTEPLEGENEKLEYSE